MFGHAVWIEVREDLGFRRTAGRRKKELARERFWERIGSWAMARASGRRKGSCIDGKTAAGGRKF